VSPEAPFRISLAHEFCLEIEPCLRPGTAGLPGENLIMATGASLLRELTVLFYALVTGLTLSGITANIYRILARKAESRSATAIYYGVMVFAGASVLLENATRSYRKKDCSALAYGFAAALVGYWCFILGLLVLTVVLSVLKNGQH
jgi:hypothetical protein